MDGPLLKIKEHIDQLIETYGEDAALDFDGNHHEPYDQDPSPRFRVMITREETDMEYQRRTANEALLKSNMEAHERREFERLQKKFNSTKE
jgi:hypothetical protein